MHRSVLFLLIFTLPLIGAPVCRADVSAEQVRSAISKGVEYLKKTQQNDGRWPEVPSFDNGVTALCTLALINAGVSLNDDHVKLALTHLRNSELSNRTYVNSLMLMVFCQANPEQHRVRIKELTVWLVNAQNPNGAWGYGNQHLANDPSNSQFALLALHEAERFGLKIDEVVWKRARDYWLARQRPDGGWNYNALEGSTISMTCAGVSSLVISNGKLGNLEDRITNGVVDCCTATAPQEAVRRGLAFLAKNLSIRGNPLTGDKAFYYYMYGTERVGRLLGQRFIGKSDWYRNGAEVLLNLQDGFSGRWVGTSHGENHPPVATSLSLLFLSKGRRPVVVSRMQYGNANSDNWNKHPQALQNITQHIEKRWEMDLTWQTIDIKLANVNDLLETPVLFISGYQSLQLTDAEKDRLVQYVNSGGFLFVEACCRDEEFDLEFRRLMQEMFPNAPLKPLPPEHAVWYADKRIDPRFVGELEGVDVCCRTNIIYSRVDLGCYWELDNPYRDENYPQNVEDEVQQRINIGTNVLAYATNRQLQQKLDRPRYDLADASKIDVPRGVLRIPKVNHAGGSDDAPNALSNLLLTLQKQSEIRVSTFRRLLGESEELFDYPILFIHGRRGFTFSPAQRQLIKTFIQRGGFVFGDSICASDEFATAFKREMSEIFPGNELPRMPISHPIFSDEFGGFTIRQVTLREPAERENDEPARSTESRVVPNLEAITIGGRTAVVFSPFDLSCSLENQVSLECKGYITRDAGRLGVNIVLFGLQQ